MISETTLREGHRARSDKIHDIRNIVIVPDKSETKTSAVSWLCFSKTEAQHVVRWIPVLHQWKKHRYLGKTSTVEWQEMIDVVARNAWIFLASVVALQSLVKCFLYHWKLSNSQSDKHIVVPLYSEKSVARNCLPSSSYNGLHVNHFAWKLKTIECCAWTLYHSPLVYTLGCPCYFSIYNSSFKFRSSFPRTSIKREGNNG